MPLAQDLIEQARHLANREPKRPKQASLRRAVSTAYYALFHLLTTAAVANWKTPRHRAALARAFEHRRMHDACARARARSLSEIDPETASQFKTVIGTFIELQQF